MHNLNLYIFMFLTFLYKGLSIYGIVYSNIIYNINGNLWLNRKEYGFVLLKETNNSIYLYFFSTKGIYFDKYQKYNIPLKYKLYYYNDEDQEKVMPFRTDIYSECITGYYWICEKKRIKNSYKNEKIIKSKYWPVEYIIN